MTRLLMRMFELSLTNCFRTQVALLAFQNDSILFPPVDQPLFLLGDESLISHEDFLIRLQDISMGKC